MAANKRVFYAVEQILIAPASSTSPSYSFTTFNDTHVVHGGQSAGVRTDFRLEQIFELGQLAIYENIENIPNIEMTVERVLDGYPLAWHLATSTGSTSPSLIGRSNAKAMVAMGIYPDTQDNASGTAVATMMLSGAYVSSLAYNFPVNGQFTENLTLVCNNKLWYSPGGHRGSGPSALSGFFDGTHFSNPDSPVGIGGVNRREDLLFETGVPSGGSYAANTSFGTDANSVSVFAHTTNLPVQVVGNSSGLNLRDANGDFTIHAQSIRVNSNFGREELFELGRRAPYHRFVKFPTEVTTEIEVLSVSGECIEALEDGVYSDGNNLRNESIRIASREGTRINLGVKNKLASVNIGGGDTGGSNQTITYTYTTFNDFTVLHTGDPKSTFRFPLAGSGNGGAYWLVPGGS
jgi:hypothetical protein